jgi:hypothetical protein
VDYLRNREAFFAGIFGANDMAKPKHNCPIEACTAGRGEGQIMCRPHWDLVPKALQRRVYAEYHRKQGSESHLRAIRDAVQHVNDLLDEKLINR